ncbi:glycosyl hydrolase family 3, N-terminal domain protein [Bifidobacterium saguini DSM 23967]|uniref:Glycosyl hydrolase family 3, N-terminal domain protein n=2 Tax=Bifidobacterium saguini TaxID=762210 RepID=A0A087D8Q1_9BIFI|nr:glycoside hydrolase family 3 N-terminal domain-containing protein [Bifidobacterium saguini]KFI91901.1 glycosyl hydrolase family 3, N-terminal domain protein [Bifidobacterium saguini DSM 23967]QTB89981.1 glycoside hydrolase family 3 C-terminal domain-containing protein [Bifidobacterium saguini]
MLDINMSDVIAVLKSLTPYLVVLGVVLVAAIIITIAVNKKTVRDVSVRKLVHSESWLVVLVAATVSIALMLTGPMATLLNNATAKKYKLSDETIAAANTQAQDLYSEAVTMLQNNDNNLPISGTKKLNVFGWGSTQPILGGSGSGSMSNEHPMASILSGLKQAGFETNSELTDLYTKYRAERPTLNMFQQDWTLPEVPADQYPDSLISDAKSFSDEAVVVITRFGGENADLPRDMKAEGVVYNNNSKDYEDFQQGESILQLSQTEKNMLDLVSKNFDHVTLVYNGSNPLQFDFLANYPQIKSVLWCPPAGQTGFNALGDILAGKVNPSGKTSDTFLKNVRSTPTLNNIGNFPYDNVDDLSVKVNFVGSEYTSSPTFVNYVEGIYVGYKFYETAADEGLINYDDTVAFPFGYGLSYTDFEQKMGDVSYKNGKVSFDVTVTNTGDKAGKDVVEAYYNPPYTNGGIEKSSVNLVAFEKTKELKPGESETVKISFDDDSMASYDAKGAKAYVLESGNYDVSIQSDSHTVIDSATVNVPKTITYDSDSNTHSGDKVAATNEFDDAEGDVNYLSRADHFANYEEAVAAPASMSMSDEAKKTFSNNDIYKPGKHDNADDKMPTTGAKNGVRLADLRGKDYDDPQWDKLLDQLTFDDMDNMIAMAGYGTAAIKNIGKIKTTDLDGPAALINNFTHVSSIAFPSAVGIANTWNKKLANEFGKTLGKMAREMHVDGWYAPGMNIHRSPFSGRNFEYFSEDSLLSGVMAAGEIAGARSQGVYSFMKHFALNDQETNRTAMLVTWANEQSIREIYLKPFEMAVKDGGAQAVMTAYNYIGTTYAGANPALLNTVLRDEWGFRGFTLTDYFAGFGYQNADQEIRNGGDAMLATMDVTNHVTSKSATSLKAMRTASHNILYTVVNSWQYENGEPKTELPIWQTGMWIGIAVVAVLFAGLEIVTVRRFVARRKPAVEVIAGEQ